MKKLLVALMAFAIVGCSSTKTPEATATPEAVNPTVPAKVQVGVGSVTTFSTADAAADKEGKAQANTTYAVVVLEDGVITHVSFDVAQNTVNFDQKGVVSTAKDAATPTKKEKGEAYGMRETSGIKKEWFEQIAALEEYAVGKTVAEFLATPVADKVTTDADLLANCTIKIDGYLAAFEVASKNVVDVEGAAYVGVGSTTSLSLANAEADKDGKAQVNTTFAVIALDEKEAIVYTSIDVAQNTMAITKEGKVTAAETSPTKKEKGEAYGMRETSGIKKEWFEQIAALEEFAVGKTVAEFVATPLAENVTTDADLLTKVTIKLNGYFSAVEAANANKFTLAKVLD